MVSGIAVVKWEVYTGEEILRVKDGLSISWNIIYFFLPQLPVLFLTWIDKHNLHDVEAKVAMVWMVGNWWEEEWSYYFGFEWIGYEERRSWRKFKIGSWSKGKL